MKKDDCIFCKIVNGDFGTEFILNTSDFVAFNDINPQSPTHILIVPKEHYDSLNDLNNPELLGKLLDGVRQVAKLLGLSEYRTIINTGKSAGQTVFHLHLHLLAGRELNELLG